jgi:hypothetical protein
MVTVNYATSYNNDLLNGGSVLLELAVLAARGSAAAQRVIDGETIDDADKQSLSQISKLFRTSAANVNSYVQQRPSTEPLFGSLAATVDVAIDAISHDAVEGLDVSALEEALNANASRVEAFISNPSAGTASPLVILLANLLSAVLRETGHIGETALTI